jgi:hypothetical protein
MRFDNFFRNSRERESRRWSSLERQLEYNRWRTSLKNQVRKYYLTANPDHILRYGRNLAFTSLIGLHRVQIIAEPLANEQCPVRLCQEKYHSRVSTGCSTVNARSKCTNEKDTDCREVWQFKWLCASCSAWPAPEINHSLFWLIETDVGGTRRYLAFCFSLQHGD